MFMFLISFPKSTLLPIIFPLFLAKKTNVHRWFRLQGSKLRAISRHRRLTIIRAITACAAYGFIRILISQSHEDENTDLMLSSVFVLTPFLGDITRFFESGRRFKIRQRPGDAVFAAFQIGF